MTPNTVIHVCPACRQWQVDYVWETLGEYGYAMSVVEDLVRDHVMECFGFPEWLVTNQPQDADDPTEDRSGNREEAPGPPSLGRDTQQ